MSSIIFAIKYVKSIVLCNILKWIENKVHYFTLNDGECMPGVKLFTMSLHYNFCAFDSGKYLSWMLSNASVSSIVAKPTILTFLSSIIFFIHKWSHCPQNDWSLRADSNDQLVLAISCSCNCAEWSLIKENMYVYFPFGLLHFNTLHLLYTMFTC